MVPPGRQTRSSCSATARWLPANIAPKHDVTTSKAASSNGSASASPSIQSSVLPAARPPAGPRRSVPGADPMRRPTRLPSPRGWQHSRYLPPRRARAVPARCRTPEPALAPATRPSHVRSGRSRPWSTSRVAPPSLPLREARHVARSPQYSRYVPALDHSLASGIFARSSATVRRGCRMPRWTSLTGPG